MGQRNTDVSIARSVGNGDRLLSDVRVDRRAEKRQYLLHLALSGPLLKPAYLVNLVDRLVPLAQSVGVHEDNEYGSSTTYTSGALAF